MIQETEYDEVMTCVHKYQERCHETFTTVYEPHQVFLNNNVKSKCYIWQEQECDEKYKKVCTIAFEDVANNEEVEICRTNFIKDCNNPGPEECQTVYETECTTYQKVHDVEDDVTNCVTQYEEKCQEVTLGMKFLVFSYSS